MGLIKRQAVRVLVPLISGVIFAGCQPEQEDQPVPPGAVPAAPDMRPGSEAAPGGTAVPGAETDTAAGQPRDLPSEGEVSAEEAAP